jgi:hypothetical protein
MERFSIEHGEMPVGMTLVLRPRFADSLAEPTVPRRLGERSVASSWTI